VPTLILDRHAAVQAVCERLAATCAGPGRQRCRKVRFLQPLRHASLRRWTGTARMAQDSL